MAANNSVSLSYQLRKVKMARQRYAAEMAQGNTVAATVAIGNEQEALRELSKLRREMGQGGK